MKRKHILDIPEFLKISAEERKRAWQTETEFVRRMQQQSDKRFSYDEKEETTAQPVGGTCK